MSTAQRFREEPKDIPETVAEIVARNERVREHWSSVYGWAPPEAADLLAKSRLDRQVSLSNCLALWLEPTTPDNTEGRLILAWVNLGGLVEGTMKFFFSVFLDEYSRSPVQRRNEPVDPDVLSLEELRQFFRKEHAWMPKNEQRWDQWVLRIQQRRNAIHAYETRNIGTFDEFKEDLKQYVEFLDELEGRVPYPEPW